MATSNPRVTAYIQPTNKERLKEYQQKHGLATESQAIDRILSEYFVGVIPIADSVTLKRISDTPKANSDVLGNSLDMERVEDLVKGYYAQAMNQMNGAIAELMQEVGQRLGE